MLSNSEVADVQIRVNLGLEVDAETLDQSTRLLRSELQEFVDEISFISEGTAPTGTRSAEVVTIGALALATLPTVLPELIKFIYSWCLRAEQRSVEIEIKRSKRRSIKLKITGDISSERLKEIISLIQKQTD